MSVPVFVSVHDVMPETLSAVQSTLEQIHGIPNQQVHLLIVPGCDWAQSQLDLLKRWRDQGFEFSGHGRVHRCGSIRTFKHRLHSLLISRNVAEHLSLSSDEIFELIGDCHEWFRKNQLGEPEWYVPPAWAMGNISRKRLSELPFRFYEYQTGVWDSQVTRFYRMPLLGYEADTFLRAAFLSVFNWANRLASSGLSRPIRLSIHPHDLEYRLKDHLADDIRALANENKPAKFHAEAAGAWLNEKSSH